MERAHIGDTRDVPVEIVVNGSVASRQTFTADGKLHELKFEVPVRQSSWIAASVLPAAHTNRHSRLWTVTGAGLARER